MAHEVRYRVSGPTYQIDEDTAGDLRNRFTHHPPQPGQITRYVDIRDHAHELALRIVEETPKSREQALALTNLEQAVFWANAAIARNE